MIVPKKPESQTASDKVGQDLDEAISAKAQKTKEQKTKKQKMKEKKSKKQKTMEKGTKGLYQVKHGLQTFA